jgi:hypothetical protein
MAGSVRIWQNPAKAARHLIEKTVLHHHDHDGFGFAQIIRRK